MGLAPAAEGEGNVSPEEVFALLGNETRMQILHALWEAYDPIAEESAVSFSELYDAAEVDDSGQFNYHLDKLRGTYVRRTDAGYEFNPVGLKLVQSVIAGAGQEISFEPVAIDVNCRLCSGDTYLAYEAGKVLHVCADCDGHFDDPAYPDGTLWGTSFPPAGVVDRSPEELFATLSFKTFPVQAMLSGGICPRCNGPLDQSIEVCEEHAPAEDGPCPQCGYTQPFRVNWVCTVCKYHATGSIGETVKNHPAVIAFYYDHDISFGYPYAPNSFDAIREHEQVQRAIEYDEEAVSTDPLRLRVTIEYEDDAISLTLDEELAVLDVTET